MIAVIAIGFCYRKQLGGENEIRGLGQPYANRRAVAHPHAVYEAIVDHAREHDCRESERRERSFSSVAMPFPRRRIGSLAPWMLLPILRAVA